MNEATKSKPPARRPGLPVLGSPADVALFAPTPAANADAVRVGVVTLGCDKNTVDSERMLARLMGAGASVHAGVENADVVVINTCGFIDMAKEESVDTILDAVRLKSEGRIRAVVAVGCLVQRYGAELTTEIPEVDLFLGLTEADQLVPRLRSRGLLPAEPPPVPLMERPLRVLTRRRSHSSHLKISEGCDHTCAFCAIPLMRGKHRSTPIELLVREARELEAQGVVELNIVSQDTTWYGRDLARGVAGGAPASGEDSWYVGRPFAGMAGVDAATAERVARARVAGRAGGGVAGGGPAGGGAAGGARAAAAGGTRPPASGARRGQLPELLEALLAETSIPWLRLFYMYPSGIYPELVELMARSPRLLPYLDMPIQHGSDGVLRRMRRPERRATIRERVGWLRAAVPDLALRTTVIVGFPGETDEEFEELLDLLEEIRFDRVGAFTYSAEENTLAAVMAEQVPAEVQRERLERLLDVARGIAQERSEGWIGREVEVLIDEPGVGRTQAQAPEVDGVVLLSGAEHARAGQFARVRITGAQEEDLVGTVTGVVRA